MPMRTVFVAREDGDSVGIMDDATRRNNEADSGQRSGDRLSCQSDAKSLRQRD